MYRTFVSLFTIVVFTEFYYMFVTNIGLCENYSFYIIIGLLLILFMFSFKKQTSYIRQRVEKIKVK